tara:strand:- start:109 stop:585 length:477 start_codon:yes stop_codon:yes gene_type:complete
MVKKPEVTNPSEPSTQSVPKPPVRISKPWPSGRSVPKPPVVSPGRLRNNYTGRYAKTGTENLQPGEVVDPSELDHEGKGWWKDPVSGVAYAFDAGELQKFDPSARRGGQWAPADSLEYDALSKGEIPSSKKKLTFNEHVNKILGEIYGGPGGIRTRVR